MYPTRFPSFDLTQLVVRSRYDNDGELQKLYDLNEKLTDSLTEKNFEIIALQNQMLVQADKIEKLYSQLCSKRASEPKMGERPAKRRKIAAQPKQKKLSDVASVTSLENANSPSSDKQPMKLDTSIPAFDHVELSLFSPPVKISGKECEGTNLEFSKQFPLFGHPPINPSRTSSQINVTGALRGRDAVFSPNMSQ